MTEHEIEKEFSAKLKWIDEAYQTKQIGIYEYEAEIDALEDWLENKYARAGLKSIKERMHTEGPSYD